MISYETKIENVVYDPQSLQVKMALGEPCIHRLLFAGLKDDVFAFDDAVVIKRGTDTVFSGKIEKLSYKIDSKDTVVIGKGEGYRAFRKTYTGNFVDATLLTILCDILNDCGIQDTASVTGEAVGTGDGSTTVFYLANKLVKYDSQTIYLGGTPQAEGVDYTFDDAYGKITFTTAPGSGVAITADYTYYVTGTIDDSKTEGSNKKWDTEADFDLWTLDTDLVNEGGYIKKKVEPYQDGSMTDPSQIDEMSGGPAIDPWVQSSGGTETGGITENLKEDGYLKNKVTVTHTDLTKWQQHEWTFSAVRGAKVEMRWGEWKELGTSAGNGVSTVRIQICVDGVWTTVVERTPNDSWNSQTWQYGGQEVTGVRIYTYVKSTEEGIPYWTRLWVDYVRVYGYCIEVHGKNGDVVKVYEGSTELDSRTISDTSIVLSILDASSLPFNGSIKVNDGTTEREWNVYNIDRFDLFRLRNYQATKYARSPDFKPVNGAGWDKLKSLASEGAGNDIQYYVIDPNNGDATIIGPINYESLPYDISSVTQEEIAVKVAFINNGKVTDSTVDWVELVYPTGGIDISFNNELAYKAIQKISEIFIRDFYYDFSGLIHIVTERTRDKTSISFQYGVNLSIISLDDDFTNYANKITVLGDGISATTQDDAEIAKYGGDPDGVIHKSYVNKDLKDANTCGGYAQWLLGVKSKSNVVVKAKITGLNEVLLPGDKVHVETPVLNDSLKISKITYNYGRNGEIVETEFRAFIPKITDYLKDIDLTKRWTL